MTIINSCRVNRMRGRGMAVTLAGSGWRSSALRRDSGQDVVDGDLAELSAVDHQGDLLAGLEDPARLVTGRTGSGVNLDLAIDQVDDPIHRDAAAGIRPEFP